MNYIDWCKDFYHKHPATSIGVVAGVVLGVSFAAFGFWKTIIVAVCVGLGFFVGWRLDHESDFAAKIGAGLDNIIAGIKQFFGNIGKKRN